MVSPNVRLQPIGLKGTLPVEVRLTEPVPKSGKMIPKMSNLEKQIEWAEKLREEFGAYQRMYYYFTGIIDALKFVNGRRR